jgi:hypothetical protein
MSQCAPECPGCGQHLLPAHLRAPPRRTRQLQQRAPYQPFAQEGRSRHQRALLLPRLQHLAHVGAGGAPRRLGSKEGARAVRHGRHRRVRPVLVRMPVQEGEAKEVRLRQRVAHQSLPEGEESRSEGSTGLAMVPAEGDIGFEGEVALGVLAHCQGQPQLAAVMTVEAAHRHAHGLGQFARLHILKAPLRQRPGRLAHAVGMNLLHKPGHPLNSFPAAGTQPARNERSFRQHLSTGRV